MSADPLADKPYTVAYTFDLNGRSHSFSFQSVAEYRAGETFPMQANPRHPQTNSMQPERPLAVWLRIGFAIGWLCLGESLLHACNMPRR